MTLQVMHNGYKDLQQAIPEDNITVFEAKVAERVANNEFATLDIHSMRYALRKEPFRLDDDFIAKYVGKEPAWGDLGWFTFKRTYARRVDMMENGVPVLDDNGDPKSIRTEEWTEVVRRVVEGNLSILANDPVVNQSYGQKLYNLIWNLIFTPPGRGLWITGTPFAERTGDAYNNCWFVETRPYHYGSANLIFTRYTIDPEKKYVSYPFAFLFDQAMKGGGVGFSVEDHFIAEIPEIQNKAKLYFSVDKTHPDYLALKVRAKDLGLSLNKASRAPKRERIDLTVADSREGWTEAYAMVIDEHFRSDKKEVSIHIDLSEVRAYGRKIKGFGGVASGSMPLMELLGFTNKLLNSRRGQKLSAVDCTELHNSTGRAVIAGNVRRTAEVALATRKNVDFINMKNYRLVEHVTKEWTYDENTGKSAPVFKTVEELVAEGYTKEQAEKDIYTTWAQLNHRWTSNNSVVIDDPREYDFGFISPHIETNGEPGIFNRFLAQNFGRVIDGYRAKKDKATGGNPCMEIQLESGEPCNLVEYMLPVALKHGISHEEVIPFMVHLTKRVTFTKYDWQRSAEVIAENRRIGVSISGFADWVLLKFGKAAIVGWRLFEKDVWNDMTWKDPSEVPHIHFVKQPEYDAEVHVLEPIYNEDLIAEMDHMYRLVAQADIEYSAVLTKALGYEVKPSVRSTTVKPSGTVALLAGISPGVHSHYFKYGTRRIKVQADDPLLGLVKLAGFRTEESFDSPNSHVIEFPFKAPTADYEDFRSADEMTIEEQFAMQAFLAMYWADNMVSCTITFHPEEAYKVKHLLTQYRMRIKSTSLLPYSGHGYRQAPYEPYVTLPDGTTPEEQYTARMKEIHMKPEDLYHLLMDQGDFEDRQMDLAEMVECQGGHCPVK